MKIITPPTTTHTHTHTTTPTHHNSKLKDARPWSVDGKTVMRVCQRYVEHCTIFL
jgi:hypothetical protein